LGRYRPADGIEDEIGPGKELNPLSLTRALQDHGHAPVAGLTPDELAQAAGVTKRTVHRLECIWELLEFCAAAELRRTIRLPIVGM